MLITYYINNVCGLLSKLHYAKLRLILLSWGTNAYFLRCPAILKSFSMIGNNFPGEVNFSDFVTIFVMAIRIVGFLLYIRLLFVVFKEYIRNKSDYIGCFLGIMVMSLTITMGPSYKILWIILMIPMLTYCNEKSNER